jgi:hypothetical protein
LLRGRVQAGGTDFTVEVHPQIRAIIHWEEYEYNHASEET